MLFILIILSPARNIPAERHIVSERVLTDFRPDEISEKFDEIHEIERQADEERHKLNDMLIKAFITPIEREDIAALSHDLDEVTDKIEDVLIRIYINNVQSIRPEAIRLLDTVIKCCDALLGLLKEFSDFRKSKELSRKIIEINTLEEEADKLYISVCASSILRRKMFFRLLRGERYTTIWKNVPMHVEHAADVIGSVVMKNS